MLIDTENQCVAVPIEKITKAIDMINEALTRKSKKVTLKQLQQICGFLNFLGKCVIPGRAFTRRLYAYTANDKLKPHHHIRINGEMRSDLEMWITFLQHPSVYSRPFLDFSKTLVADEIDMYSDASGTIGFGAWCGNDWMYNLWDNKFIKKYKPSIEYLELFGVVAGVLTWIHRFKNMRVILFCDNETVVNMINLTTTSCRNCMVLIRILVLKGMIENVRIFCRHVAGKKNILADNLSRNRLDLFEANCRKQKRIMTIHATDVPDAIWPISKIWKY